jgi:Na+/H+ antiporter NhaC
MPPFCAGIAVEVLHDATRLTLAIISSAAFGMKINAFSEDTPATTETGKYSMSFTR